MKSTAKQENKFNFKRNIYIPKMCVDLGPGGLQHSQGADKVNCNFMTVLFQNSELVLVQCECHIGKQTVIARINPTNRK